MITQKWLIGFNLLFKFWKIANMFIKKIYKLLILSLISITFLSSCGLLSSASKILIPTFDTRRQWFNSNPLNYSESKDNEIFDFIKLRSISIMAVLGDPVAKQPTSTVTGTATILGPADQATAEGNAYNFYIASNIHVLKSFQKSIDAIVHQNVPLLYFYSFNPTYLDKDLQSISNSNQLQDENKNSVNFRFNQNQPNFEDYHFMSVAQDSFWTATNIRVNTPYVCGTINCDTLPSTPISNTYQYKNRNYAVDFAVLKVNLKPKYRFVNRNDWEENTELEKKYLEKLRANILKYGDLNFFHYPKNNEQIKGPSPYAFSDDGYLLSYPANKQVASEYLSGAHTKPINLKLNRSDVELKPKFILNNSVSNLSTLEYNNQIYYTAGSEFRVENLDIGNGASGSGLIGYRPDLDDKKKFYYLGIYWGVYSSTIDDRKITGGISFISDPFRRYNLLGNKSSLINSEFKSSFDHNNTLCSFIENQVTETEKYIPEYCS